MKNNLYNEDRRFDKVFPTFEIFSENTTPYLIGNQVDSEILEVIYKRLKLAYGSSFYAYSRIGTIYEKNVEGVSKMLLLYQRYLSLKKAIDNEFQSKSVTRDYETDYEKEDVIAEDSAASLTTYSENEYKDSGTIQTYTKQANDILQQINIEINRYAVYMLNNLYYKRGGYYD